MAQQKDMRDKKDFGNMMNNEHCLKNRIFKCDEYSPIVSPSKTTIR
jgi:hypothetical protein